LSPRPFSYAGLQTAYEQRKLRQLKKLGAMVTVSTRMLASAQDSRELVTETKRHGPLGGIFIVCIVSFLV